MQICANLNHRKEMRAEPVGWFLESLQQT